MSIPCVARTLLSWGHIMSKMCPTRHTRRTHVSCALLKICHVCACSVHFNVVVSVFNVVVSVQYRPCLATRVSTSRVSVYREKIWEELGLEFITPTLNQFEICVGVTQLPPKNRGAKCIKFFKKY